jgi:ribose transport system permease protein
MTFRIFVKRILRYPWIWSAQGTLLMWILLSLFSGKFSFNSLITISVSASFLAIMAFGQMLVVTTGRGAIDLSISGVITLAAFLVTGWADGNNLNLVWAIPAVLSAGLIIGLCNAALVLYLQIPPMIATLGVNYILVTFILLFNKNFKAFEVAPLLIRFTRIRIMGVVPLMVMLVVFLIIMFSVILQRTRFGKSLLALGQNLEAAAVAGIRTNQTQIFAYCLSSMLAAFGGILISARVGGAFLGLGDPYQLQTVASVVVGGTLISGGRAVPVGTFFGSMFLILLTTSMQVAGMKAGGQYIITGLFIISVLFLAARNEIQ